MSYSEKLMIARKIVQLHKGLARLPKPDNREAVALADSTSLPLLKKRLAAAAVEPVLPAEPEGTVIGAGDTFTAVSEMGTVGMFEAAAPAHESYFTVNVAAPDEPTPEPAFRRAAPTPITKKTPYGRIIRTITRGDRELVLHATKGWRERRA